MRIAIHDYAGHPFQVDLSRALARRGHAVAHLFFAEDIGPKGPSTTGPDDPATLAIEPISIGVPYSKSDFLRRRAGDVLYGKAAAAALRRFAPEVIVSGNTPLEAQSLIRQAAQALDAAFVFWMQDAYSLAIERIIGRRWVGLGRLVADHYKRIEARLLRGAEAVVLISSAFRDPVKRFGVAEDRIFVIPNWGSLATISPRPKANPWAAAHGLADKFVFLYSGTLALKHDPHLLWALAEAHRHDPGVEVVVAATGVSVAALRARQAADPLPNLTFLPLQPVEAFADMLGAADVLVALLETDAGAFSVPSKVLSYLCAGRPVLMSGPIGNLAAEIVEQAGAGIVAQGGGVADFLAAARRLQTEPALREAQGAAARRYAEAHFDVEEIAVAFERVLVVALSRGAARGRAGSLRLERRPVSA